jgi:HD-like signal output (HDOD) protein
VNAREIWEDYRKETGLPVETAAEIALQKSAFICGLITACGRIALGEDLHEIASGAEELFEEAARDLFLEADR